MQYNNTENLKSQKTRYYLCIDMKTFYASVECAERGLNPFETNLVVADISRGRGALCLAVSPKLKAQGVKNRCRLFEIPECISYEAAPPQMRLYIEYAADIYALYLKYFRPEDIHVYSIDESFIDVTDYLGVYKTDAVSLAKKLMDEIAEAKHIPSTAGVGTNLYLAKVALDISAKHTRDHIAFLDEETFRKTLWEHRPITDFWHVASGTARRLEHLGISTMRGVAECPQEVLYKTFGRDAELLIDHAWGRETCLMEDIKNYRAKSHFVSFSQILPRDYSYGEARVVVSEMALHGSHELIKRKLISKKIYLSVGYSRDTLPVAQGHTRLTSATQAYSLLCPNILSIFDSIVQRDIPIRRLALCFEDVCDEGCAGYDFFTDWQSVERELERERAVLAIKEKYGKNAVLRGTNFLDGATQRERNAMIGGHRAGYDEAGESKAVRTV